MVYTAPEPEKPIPTNISIYNILFNNDRNIPKDTTLFIDAEDPSISLTYEQLRTQILKCAANLKNKLELKPKDVVAICSPNCIDYIVLLHATVCAGGVLAAIDYASIAQQIASDVDVSQAKYLIAHSSTLDQALEAAKSVGLPRNNILVFGDEKINGIRSVTETLLSGDELAVPYDYSEYEIMHSPAYLYYTSGTTGKKKAVMMTQYNILASFFIKDNWEFSTETVIAYTEFHHASSLCVIMHIAIFYGFTVYVMTHYSLPKLCQAIQDFKVTFFATQPYIIASMAKEEITNKYDFSSLKGVICGGAALDNAVTRLAVEKLGIYVLNAYGMTEALGMFLSDPAITFMGGVGAIAPGFSAKIIDEDGNDVEEGQMGELIVKGPTITQGYYRNLKATKSTIDSDGYLHTGDLFRCNKDGIFFYIDRHKDLIKYKLHHIYPSDIESVLFTHPMVSDCAVIGVYYPEFTTELPRAYIQLVGDEKYNPKIEQEIQTYADSRLPNEKRLRGGVVIVNSFPRTASGKIQRRILREKSSQSNTISI
ncbi:acetyl-CoA synthetase-like protein [Backusella circina FSU 941]|nr:acetyl-CoA synthetase-like protein [Backusella circina FSU 941]